MWKKRIKNNINHIYSFPFYIDLIWVFFFNEMLPFVDRFQIKQLGREWSRISALIQMVSQKYCINSFWNYSLFIDKKTTYRESKIIGRLTDETHGQVKPVPSLHNQLSRF